MSETIFQNASPWRDKQGIADYYGVSLRTISNWMRQRILPYTKVRKSIRFNIHECDRAMAAMKLESVVIMRAAHAPKLSGFAVGKN